MPKRVGELNESDLRSLKIGTHFVGGVGGLTLQVGSYSERLKRRSASWVLRIYVGERRQNIGLGSYPEISLAEARRIALEQKQNLSLGYDPLQQKRAVRRTLAQNSRLQTTFKQCALEFLEFYTKGLSNKKHIAQWYSTLHTYAIPELGNRRLEEITTQDIVSVLRKTWFRVPETTRRLQGRIEKIFDYAISAGYRESQNPARWRNHLSIQLPNPERIRSVKNYPSLPYQLAPQFVAVLEKQPGIAAKALLFLILTAVRSGSVRNARWQDLNLATKEWNIPGGHTKTGRPHRVPLTPQMLCLLDRLGRDSELLFPSRKGQTLSDMSLNALMRAMLIRGVLSDKAVPHGFRSTFKVWAMECTDYPSELSEMCLMHSIGSRVYQAYQRSDLFIKRRQLMEAWSNFLYN